MSDLPVVLVTGSNSGVGLSLVVKLSATHRVFASMRGPITADKRKALDSALEELNDESRTSNVTVLELDVGSDASVEEGVKEMLSKTNNRCDILINNAGYSLFGSVEMLEMASIKAQFETNVFGVIRCQQAVLPAMRAVQKGKIINLSSVGGIWGQPFNDVYCASKFAIEGLAESQAPLFRTFGVHVTSIQPGGIKTKFIENAQRPDMSKVPAEYAKPMGSTMNAYRSGSNGSQTADEVADVIISRVVECDNPPLKIQTNVAIQPIAEGQLKDPTGEWGVAAATQRFLEAAL